MAGKGCAGPGASCLPVQSAEVRSAEAVPAEQAVEAAPVEIAAADPVPAPSPVTFEAPTPMIQSIAAPVREASRGMAPVRATAAARFQQAAFRFSGKDDGHWVVQLGAYDNAAIAKEKWFSMARRNGVLANLPVVTSQITVNGATFARLAVGGFDARAEAVALCRAIQARRGQCFVRENVADATPQRWALATRGRQYASR